MHRCNLKLISLVTKLITLVALLFTGFAAVAAEDNSAALMSQLHQAIAHRDEYEQAKENRLAALRQKVEEAPDNEELFYALGDLLEEYRAYNTDSALSVCRRREEVANRIGESGFIISAKINTAQTFSRVGMCQQSLNTMRTIVSEDVPPGLRPLYYHVYRLNYGIMADLSVTPEEHAHYDKLTKTYLDSLQMFNIPGTLSYVLAEASVHNARREYRDAIAAVEDYMDSSDFAESERAMCAFTLSESYALLKDVPHQREQLLIAAIADMKAATREYAALTQLAMLLYQEGDLKNAYDFLKISLDDAAKCDARQRMLELSNIFPLVNEMYVSTIEKQRTTLRVSVWVISMLFLFLLVAIFFVVRQMRNTAAVNHSLSSANRDIAENSTLKEEYIGRYMDQCSIYIDKIDSYRKSLGKMIAAGQVDRLQTELKSTDFVKDELKAFYRDFDTTFLKLFPHFVEHFNELLRPEERIYPKKEGQLTTELRIFALIRLGITDSAKIAQFLRYSVTTIYNYRTKVRNKALGERDKFESAVANIGQAAR